MISKTRLRLSAWISLVNLLFYPIYVVYAFTASVSEENRLTIFHGLEIISLAIFIFIFLTFNQLLKDQFHFYRLEKMIWLLIYTKLLGLIFSFAFPFIPFWTGFKYLSTLMTFAGGIFSLILSFRLLSLNESLYGMRRLISYLIMFQGIWSVYFTFFQYCYRLVDYQLIGVGSCNNMRNLLFWGLLIRFTVYIGLAILFFKAAKKLPSSSVSSVQN